MQSYPFTLKPGNSSAIQLSAQGNLFVYESGTGANDASEVRVWVKPDTGSEILLRPGQRFRPSQKANLWNIRLMDGGTQIDGYFIIGEGDFDDANTKNVFKLDAEFANVVTVDNDAAHRIPVALDSNVPLTIAGSTVTYTTSWANDVASDGTATILTPAANVNGAYLEFAMIDAAISNGGGQGYISAAIVAKASAPASATDGDVLLVCRALSPSGGVAAKTTTLPNRVKVPAGKGVYLVQSGVGLQILKTALLTVL